MTPLNRAHLDAMASGTAMLERLMVGTEKTCSIIVQDSSKCNGRLLLKAIALQNLQRFSFVHLFLFDVHPQFWLNGAPPESVKRLTVHDCYSDHLDWKNSSLHEATPINYLHRIERACEQATPTLSDRAIIIDSLSTILDFHSTSHVCRLLHQLGRRCGLVVCLYHSDVHESHVTSQLSHVMTTTIDITIPPLQPGYHYQARLLHRKTSGKLLVQTELVTVSDNFTVTSLPSAVNHTHLQAGQMPPDPTANLTFDLTLSEREREERDRLVLPYHHSAEQKTALLLAGFGRVFYQPDQADDYDDSDPDDDLDL